MFIKLIEPLTIPKDHPAYLTKNATSSRPPQPITLVNQLQTANLQSYPTFPNQGNSTLLPWRTKPTKSSHPCTLNYANIRSITTNNRTTNPLASFSSTKNNSGSKRALRIRSQLHSHRHAAFQNSHNR